MHLRQAIELGGRFYHVFLFFRAYTGYFSIVFYADEQTAPIGIGKGRQGAGYLAGIRNFKFKILLLMFAFSY